MCIMYHVILITILSLCMAEKRVVVHDGRAEVVGYEMCTLTNEGRSVNVTTGKAEGFWFGLVYYQCGTDFGYVISKMDCFECGLYCVKNDYIAECQNTVLQRLVGFACGMATSALVCLALYLGLAKALETAWHNIVAWRQARSDAKANKVADIIEKTTMISATPAYKDKHKIVAKHGKAYKNRKANDIGPYSINNLRKVDNKVLDADLGIDEITIASEIEDGRMRVIKERRGSGSSGKSVSNSVLLTMMIVSLVSPTMQCDMNFYFKTNGNICNDNNCYDINMYTFMMNYGETVCFTGSSGDITRFKIVRSTERIRYQMLYKTSNATIASETYWACEGKENCEKNSCFINKKHDAFTKWTGINGYSCMTTSSPCDTYCFYGGHCVYYHWNVKPVGVKTPVYGLVSKIWELEVKMESNGLTTKAVMNVNNPSVNMEMESIKSRMTVPMYVAGVDYEEEAIGRTGVMVADRMLDVSASEKNFPVGGSIGDFQLSIDEETATIDESMIKCQVDNCKGKCNMQEPSISRIYEHSKNYNSFLVTRTMSRGHIVEASRKIRPTLTLGVGNVDFKNLFVKPTKCKFSVAMTFGCVACNIKPYAVIESLSIEEEGIVAFDSNCTFSRKYLSCSSTPYQLEMEENYKICMIYIPVFNQTITLNVNYQYQGELSPMRTIIGKESFSTIAASIVTSQPFYETVFQTVTGCAILSTVVTVTVRIAKLYALTKVSKETEHEIEMA